MPILSIIKLFLALVSSLANYAHDKQLMDAGASEAILKGLRDADDAITRARIAGDNANKLPVSTDQDNLDNK